ncbi:virulence factor SrfC family protein [Dickeya oryzae]|uniref:Virulence factor SrfC family protein n=1 Tax=Dickeya oryzae TaxID=1240404 RepID=A0AB39IU40_9GAMM|nr:virulence factor SrfC family protein [Dickeya oryzae]MCA6989350.1 virulence factor SrfC family protein [Dickeya oryzae]
MKPLTPKQLSSRLSRQLQSVSQGVDQAIAWVEETRRNVPRLDMEADRLIIKLRRCRNKARGLSESSLKEIAMGMFGLAQGGKTYLLTSLAGGENGRIETSVGGVTLDYQKNINPDNQQPAFVTRFTRQVEGKNTPNPVQLQLLHEADIARIMAYSFILEDAQNDTAELDEQHIAEHLKTLSLHRQQEPVAGLGSDDVVALWDYLTRHDARRQKPLERKFWPLAVELAPHLSIDDRASLFSVLWGERADYTSLYRHFAHTLEQLSGARKVLAPISLLVDEALQPDSGIFNASQFDRLNSPSDLSVQVRPIVNGRAARGVELSLAELIMLTAEVLIPLLSPPKETLFGQVDLLDFPGFSLQDEPEAEVDDDNPDRLLRLKPHPLSRALLRAKRAYLLERYTDDQEMNLLMVCTAAACKADVRHVGRALDFWVRHTQGENPQIRSRRKPGLIWAVTRHDRRFTHGHNNDEAVQRYVGNPGDAWGTMLAMDKRGINRMAAWLDTEVRREVKLGRINEQLSELQRELSDNLLGSWYQPAGADDPARKQHIAESMLKALQTRTGVHGELLERLLPSRDELRHLYLQQQVQQSRNFAAYQETPDTAVPMASYEPFGVGLDIDLFSDESEQAESEEKPTPVVPVVQTEEDQAENHSYEAEFARNLYRYWINHLRNLPENVAIIELLGINRPTIEMLVEELITASIRLKLEDELQIMLVDSGQLGINRESKADRQVSRALNVLGDFVAWLGFQQISESLRPDSRVNKGNKIFAKPEKQVANFGASRRLTKLSVTPVNNTAYYIYDWLIGLNEMIIQNAGYAAGRDIKPKQRERLGTILSQIKPTEG